MFRNNHDSSYLCWEARGRLPGFFDARRWHGHFRQVSGQCERYGRLEVATRQFDDRLPDGLDRVEVVDVREDVLVPLRPGELLLEQPAVEHVRRDELRVPDDRRAELERQQPGDVEVVDPEERNVVRDMVHRQCHVSRHEERAARAVGRVVAVGPLVLAHLFNSRRKDFGIKTHKTSFL